MRAAKSTIPALALCAVAAFPLTLAAQGHGTQHGMHAHGAGGMMRHDEATMPGLRGLDATPEESADLAILFRQFPDIHRSVDYLANGIRTETSSDDPEIRDTIIAHVTGMIARVDQGRDPQIFIQSPTLDIFFERGDRLQTEITLTDTGIIVMRTSDDPELVAALHIHAAEVSAMVDRGMAAVHDMMAARAP